MFRRPSIFNFSTLLALTVMFYIVYYVLLTDNFMHISVSSIISQAHHLSMKKHLLVLGLIPIYIAIMVFGAAMVGFYLGSGLQYCLKRISPLS